MADAGAATRGDGKLSLPRTPAPPRAWRRFFRLAVGTAALVAGLIYGFVVLLDPFDTLPLSPPLDRVQVAGNARFAFPSLARSPRFDSAVFGTSTSRLLRPAVLNPAFDARFANLAMNAATPYEQSRLFGVFVRAHPAPRVVMLGLDAPWCATGETFERFTPRVFPAWMYQDDLWRGYAEMFNTYAVQEAGQLLGVLVGLKAPDYGRDGYTSFVPPDSQYDPAKVAQHLARERGPATPPGERDGPPATWRFPAVELLGEMLAPLPPETRRVVFLVPFNHVLLPAPGQPAAAVWDECRRRVVAMAERVPNTVIVDFMRPSPITLVDDNYWDPVHYRVAVADQLARDLAAASRGEGSEDFRVLAASGE